MNFYVVTVGQREGLLDRPRIGHEEIDILGDEVPS